MWRKWGIGGGLGRGEVFSEFLNEREDEDELNREGVTMLGVELASALSLTEKGPVGGAVGGAMETVAFDEGLEKDRGVTVLGLPVLRQLL